VGMEPRVFCMLSNHSTTTTLNPEVTIFLRILGWRLGLAMFFRLSLKLWAQVVLLLQSSK
jgi:hypothetical protein